MKMTLMMYFRFILTLAIGLFGLCVMLTTLFESVMVNWDFSGGLDGILNRLAAKRKYVVIQDITEEEGAPKLITRLIPERRQGGRAQAPAAALPGPKKSSQQDASPRADRE